MRADLPILICDDEHGCGATTDDYYAQFADSVNGVKITRTERAPGWSSNEEGDWCPEHNEWNGR